MKSKELMDLVKGFSEKPSLAKAQAIASQLPPSITIELVDTKGIELINMGVERDAEGFEIDPQRIYQHVKKTKVDSIRLIKKAWKHGQKLAVQQWFMQFMQNHINIQTNFPHLIEQTNIIILNPDKNN